jgi:hypothetical protein
VDKSSIVIGDPAKTDVFQFLFYFSWLGFDGWEVFVVEFDVGFF